MTFEAVRDDFVRADGALGANWTDVSADHLQITSDGVHATFDGVDCYAVWAASSFGADQFSQVMVKAVPTTHYFGPIVRCDGTGANLYVATIFPSGGGIQLYKSTGSFDNFTQLGSTYSTTINIGDIVRLSVIGTTLKVHYNGAVVITQTDTDIATGRPGIAGSNLTNGSANNWTGGNGDGTVQVTFASTDSSSGIRDTYSTLSEINAKDNSGSVAGRQDMRVLRPSAPDTTYSHGFLWFLPIEPGQGNGYGDSINTAHALNLENKYNLTCIQPGFACDPWYANSDADPATQQETFMLDLVTWAKTNIAITGTEKHYLIGFSKSGFGGQALFLRNQPIFHKVASWDAATDFQTFGVAHDGTPDIPDQPTLDTYALYGSNLTTWKALGDTGTANRIWLGAGIDLITPTSDYAARLTADGILNTYTFVAADSHQWAPNPGWVGPAVAAMLGASGLSMFQMSSAIL